MISSPLAFEDFETEAPYAPAESAEFLKGVAEGEAHAMATLEAQRAAALSEIAAVLADMSFGFAEAREQLARALHPLIMQVSEAVLPDIAKQTFAAHLADTVTQAFSDGASSAISIRVAPGMIDLLGEALSNPQTDNFNFTEDPALTAGQAVLQSGDVHEILDLPALTSELQTALNGLATPERNATYG